MSGDGDFIYNYVQPINARPKLRKVDICLSGDIFEQDKHVYDIPRTEPLTFYISSISTFTHTSERYLTKVVERHLSADTECRIAFDVGKTDIRPELGDNRVEMGRITKIIEDLASDKEYILDSIIIRATASPEGSYESNKALAQKRSESVSRYYESFLKHIRDSLKHEEGMAVNLDDSGVTPEHPHKKTRIRFTPRSIPENWDDLTTLVAADTVLTGDQKAAFERCLQISDPDKREQALQRESFYKHLRTDLYPLLRTVKFSFHLHRQGIVKDTVHTTVLDTAYMRGVQALKNMEYETALDCLLPYRDFNTAVAYVGLNRNANALLILEDMPRTAEVNYLLAILYARRGDIHKAVECYVKSCQQDRMFVHRGNLDPEISALIQAYQLNKTNEEENEDFTF